MHLPTLFVAFSSRINSAFCDRIGQWEVMQEVLTEGTYVTAEGVQNVRLRRTEGKMGPSIPSVPAL